MTKKKYCKAAAEKQIFVTYAQETYPQDIMWTLLFALSLDYSVRGSDGGVNPDVNIPPSRIRVKLTESIRLL